MNFQEIKTKIFDYKQEGKELFTTSSFQTHSIVLLHILSRIEPEIPVVFINTRYHFPETLMFRDEITERLGLNMINLKPEVSRIAQKTPDGRLLFASDPDYCCFLNKTQPMEKWLIANDVWINGIRADQSEARNAMKAEQKAPHNTTRFHPMLDWNSKMIYDYRMKYDLPEHPLDSKGYVSIGCEPCTRMFDPDTQEREARWYGLNKTECGLHADLIEK